MYELELILCALGMGGMDVARRKKKEELDIECVHRTLIQQAFLAGWILHLTISSFFFLLLSSRNIHTAHT